jgi:prepilin-type N-terminal cleavage/methylation domain-containing protein
MNPRIIGRAGGGPGWCRGLTLVELMVTTGVIGILAVDQKSFSKLSPADQEIVRNRFAEAAAKLDTDNRASDQNAREALEKQGIEFIEASSAEEVARWQKMSEDTRAKLRELGRYDDALIDRILQYLDEFRSGTAANP